MTHVISTQSIDELLIQIKEQLDSKPPKGKSQRILTLFASNSTGKTRLSKSFYDQYNGSVLYFNAFTVDLFSWDNENSVLKIQADKWLFQTVQGKGLASKVTHNLEKFTGIKIEPEFNFSEGEIKFSIHSSDTQIKNIKISRGEESVFIWTIYFTILEMIIEALNDSHKEGTKSEFDHIEYIVIDDPVSSLDDSRIITIALELAELISISDNHLKFFITTHHALFFNVLFLFPMKKHKKNNYVLSKATAEFTLRPQRDGSPFAYHHEIISEIRDAVDRNEIRKYHFNLFRALLEKTANYLGYEKGWKSLLPETDEGKVIVKTLNHFSHDRLSEIEPRDLSAIEKESFKTAFNSFLTEYKIKF